MVWVVGGGVWAGDTFTCANIILLTLCPNISDNVGCPPRPSKVICHGNVIVSHDKIVPFVKSLASLLQRCSLKNKR